MADALSNLKAAILRLQLEIRRRRKKKQRPQRPGGPRPAGPNANKGCGTGAGGFGKGNSCAKEDGIPNAPRRPPALGPVNAKADFAKAKAMKEKFQKKQAEKLAAAKAKSEAYKNSPEYAQKQKQKRIDSLRKKAAAKKAEKGERDAAEKQAAAEAAAKKRAAMLQKIRIKKANEKLQVIERPKNPFTGHSDGSPQKTGETVVEWRTRQVQKDIDEFHKRADEIDGEYQKRIDEADADRRRLQEEYYNAGADKNRAKEIEEKRLEAVKRMDRLAKERDEMIHDLVGKFSAAHGGGLANVSTNTNDYQFTLNPGGSNAGLAEVKGVMSKVWAFLNRVSSSRHAASIAKQKIIVRNDSGGSHWGDEVTIGHSQSQSDAEENKMLIAKTGVHEYGHAIEDAKPSTMRAVEEDYLKRVDGFLASNPGSALVTNRYVSYYEGPARNPAKADDDGWSLGPSLLGYARRYSDFGYDRTTRAGRNAARYSTGTEVFSTGVEALYRNASDFRKRARSHFNITLLILADRL